MRASHVSVFLLLAASAPAQTTITNVTNAANRIAGGARTYGIAQGSLFVVVGKDVGPADYQQALLPLPTTDGLAGVTVQASVGGAIVDAIMVYVSATEVAAILPSSTPLGSGTVMLNNKGATASAAITVVASAFGIFTYKDTAHSGLALVFNVSPDDGSTTPNSTAQSAQAGQDILINGTGLGAIASDETQSGVVDIPGATIQVYVGVKPGAVVSAGRGVCCDGLDPSFPVPQGIAAWDVIRLTIPDGVVGCFIPVVVQIGKLVSNLGTISITPGGGACVPALSTLPPELTQQLATQTGVSLGSLAFGRTDGVTVRAAGGSTTTKKDTGSAGFSRINAPASMFTADYLFPENVCSIGGFPGPNGGVVRNGTEVPIVPLTSVTLDAGPAITVSGTEGPLQTRSRDLAGKAWWAVGLSTVIVTIVSFRVQQHLWQSFLEQPWGFVFPALAVAGFLGIRLSGSELRAFLFSVLYLLGMLTSVAFGLFPYVLPSNMDPTLSLTIYNTAPAEYGLRIGLAWWIPGMALASAYSIFTHRRFAGKIRPGGNVIQY